jgi:hypothetical protein
VVVVVVGNSGQSRSFSVANVLRASQISAHMLVISAVRAGDAPPDEDEDGDEAPVVVEEEKERLPERALRGGALPLARSEAFLARCVAKVCSCDALKAIPISQAGSLVTGGREEAVLVSVVGVGVGAEGGEAGAGTGAEEMRVCVVIV